MIYNNQSYLLKQQKNLIKNQMTATVLQILGLGQAQKVAVALQNIALPVLYSSLLRKFLNVYMK